MSKSNRHPVDELASIREEITHLRARENEIREGLISGRLDPEGDEYVVTVETKTNERIDLRKMRQHVSEDIWSPFLVTSESCYVRLERKSER